MDLSIYPDVKAFLEENRSFLQAEETVNSLLLGLAQRYQFRTDPDAQLLLLGIRKNGKPLFCGLQTPGRNLILYGSPDDAAEAAGPIRLRLQEMDHSVPGFIGPRETLCSFAAAWCSTGGSWRILREMGVYRLTRLRPVPAVPGRYRLAKRADLSLVVEWGTAFNLEALGEFDPQTALKGADQMIESKRLYFWEDERPVSMTAVGRPTRHGITLNYVYTPPELRKKGYASACVAAVSHRMLQQGFQFCTLFTDLSNPTSNKIYRALGYEPVREFLEVTMNT